MILAILERITHLNMLPKLAQRAPEIFRMIEDSVKIDPNLQLDEIIALANLAVKVDMEDIHFRVIDESCTLFKTTPDGQMILVPLRDKIREVRDDIFGYDNGDETAESVEEEEATISILNGTYTGGLAYATAQYLEANGLSVAAYDNADRQDYASSLIILNRDKPHTAAKIRTLLDLPAIRRGERRQSHRRLRCGGDPGAGLRGDADGSAHRAGGVNLAKVPAGA